MRDDENSTQTYIVWDTPGATKLQALVTCIVRSLNKHYVIALCICIKCMFNIKPSPFIVGESSCMAVRHKKLLCFLLHRERVCCIRNENYIHSWCMC